MLRLRRGKKGIELQLHELEAAIMEVVWSRQWSEFSVGDVLEVLEKKRDIAYTTVMTTVSRLYDKEILTRQRDGKRYLYCPRMNRQEFLESTARQVLDGLGPAGEQHAVALLVEKVSAASRKELDEIEALIKKRRKELGA